MTEYVYHCEKDQSHKWVGDVYHFNSRCPICFGGWVTRESIAEEPKELQPEPEQPLDTIVHQTEKRDTNPKTRFGATKPPLALIPATALIHCAMAFKDGASKYGPYNWREKAVSAMTYLNAIDRHSKQFLDGEDYDTDSLVHHLGHTMACCAIILDAIAVDNLIDDRPPKAPTADLIRRFTTKMEAAND